MPLDRRPPPGLKSWHTDITANNPGLLALVVTILCGRGMIARLTNIIWGPESRILKIVGTSNSEAAFA